MHEEEAEAVLYELPSGVYALMGATLWAFMNKQNSAINTYANRYKFIAQGEWDTLRTLAQLHNIPLLSEE